MKGKELFFDMRVLENKRRKEKSSQEALKSIVPVEWSDSVLSGKKKVKIKAAGDKVCAK